jgi:hypothetical protein
VRIHCCQSRGATITTTTMTMMMMTRTLRLPVPARMITTMTSSSSRSSAKPRTDNNDQNYDDEDDDKDVVIASTSKKNDDHNVIFFVPVAVAVAAADEGVIQPRRCPLTSTPSRRRRGGDPWSLKPRSADDNKDNDASIASASKNDEDDLRSSSGLQTSVESPAQPEAKGQRGGGGGDKRRRDNQPVRTKWGGKDGRMRWCMTRGRDDGRGRRANEVEGSRMGDNRGNIRQQD